MNQELMVVIIESCANEKEAPSPGTLLLLGKQGNM